MLLCASLVMLMTPGLAFFYGGLVGRKNVLAIMMQSFVSMGWTTVLWWAFGFSLCFSGDQKSGTDFFGIVGNLNWAALRGQASSLWASRVRHVSGCGRIPECPIARCACARAASRESGENQLVFVPSAWPGDRQSLLPCGHVRCRLSTVRAGVVAENGRCLLFSFSGSSPPE
jgi:hypothetical protein